MPLAVDVEENFAQMPLVGRPGTPLSQACGIQVAELISVLFAAASNSGEVMSSIVECLAILPAELCWFD